MTKNKEQKQTKQAPVILTWQQLAEMMDRMDPAELKRREVYHYAV